MVLVDLNMLGQWQKENRCCLLPMTHVSMTPGDGGLTS